MDGGAWWAAVHAVAMSRTRLSDFTFTSHFHALEKEMATHSRFSCLENPRDMGAWWATVYGVAQSRTQLKRLSSSSRFNPWVGKILLEEGMATHSSILACRIPMDGGAWQATVYRVTQSQTRLSD